MASQRAEQLSLSAYLRTATQPELEDFEIRRRARASELYDRFAALLGLWSESQEERDFEELVQARADASLARMLIEAKRAATGERVPRELPAIAPAPQPLAARPAETDAQLAWQRLEELVQQRVDEIMGAANRGRFLEPDFRPQNLVSAIMARQTVWDRRKHSLYFEKWGCRVCGRKDRCHQANGHCAACFTRVRFRYLALQKKWEAEHPMEELGVDPRSEAVKRLIGRLGGGK